MHHHELIEAVGTNIDMCQTLDETTLREILKDQNFSSNKEKLIYLNRYLRPKVSLPVIELHGLKPEQMDRLLNWSFVPDESVALLSNLDQQIQAPVLEIFNFYVDAIGDKGLKLTKAGNLPQKFCHDAASYLDSIPQYRQSMHKHLYPNSYDQAIRATGIVAELAGLIDSEGGKYVLTDEFLKIMASQGQARIYAQLFRVFVEDFSWCYSDSWQDIPLLQHSFLFTLYLLRKYGAEWRTTAFYQDCFLRTFPTLLLEVKPLEHYYSPEDVLRSCYSMRCLERFACFFGLLEIERDPEDIEQQVEFSLKSLPLLNDIVQFNFEN